MPGTQTRLPEKEAVTVDGERVHGIEQRLYESKPKGISTP